MTPQPSQAQLAAQANYVAGRAILANSTKKSDPLFSTTYVPATTPTVSFNLNNVGLMRGILLKVVATIANTDGAVDATRSAIGAPNLLTNIKFTDTANTDRIDTTGFHLFMVDSLKQRSVFGAAYTNDVNNFGANFAFVVCPTTLTHGTSNTVICYYWIPVSYSDDDFRGAVWMGVTSANARVSFTFNATPGLATGAAIDTTNTIYTGTNSVAITSAVVTAYQEYWDQIPVDGNGNLFLPRQDMAWMYELKWSPFTGVTAGTDNQFPYTNQRSFLSTILYYNNFPNPAFGTDLSYIKLTAANTYQHWKWDALTAALKARMLLNDDLPKGFYAFDSRLKPISTVQWGNLALYINPSTANAGAYANIYYEDFALATLIQGAQSLAQSV